MYSFENAYNATVAMRCDRVLGFMQYDHSDHNAKSEDRGHIGLQRPRCKPEKHPHNLILNKLIIHKESLVQELQIQWGIS